MSKISIKAEPIFTILDFHVTNSLLLALIVLIFFLVISISYYRASLTTEKSKLYYLINFLLKKLYQLFESVLGEETKIFFPLMGSFFIYILLQNWFGLLPGVGSILIRIEEGGHQLMAPLFRGNSADLNSTLSLAIISVILAQVYSIKYLGLKDYIARFINLQSPIGFFTGILEIIQEFSKIISFSFRLFGNIFAGEVLLSIIAFLIPFFISFPFAILELFVGLIQALVFTMLSAVFFNLAISKHH